MKPDERITELEYQVAFLAGKIRQIREAAESCLAEKGKHHAVHAAAVKVLAMVDFSWPPIVALYFCDRWAEIEGLYKASLFV